MGKKKQPTVQPRLKSGVVYRIDRRRRTFSLVKKVFSKFDFENWEEGNIAFVDIKAPPVDLTVMVVEHVTLFGDQDYVKLFVADSSGLEEMSYLYTREFISLICGKPEWVTPPQ